MFQIKDQDKVYINYPLLKTYCIDSTIEVCRSYFEYVLRKSIQQHSKIYLHINLQSFSISSFNKYYNQMKIFTSNNSDIIKQIKEIYIYYTPRIITDIRSIIGNLFTDFNAKIVYYDKITTPTHINRLFDKQ